MWIKRKIKSGGRIILGLFSALGIVGNLVNDVYHHNRKILGTDRDIFKDNPRVQANSKAVQEILERGRAEYIVRTGHDYPQRKR